MFFEEDADSVENQKVLFNCVKNFGQKILTYLLRATRKSKLKVKKAY